MTRPEAGRDFAGLLDLHRAELHAHCYRMLGSVHDADDAVQDTFLRAWRGAAGLREGASARSWLYAIATNVCLTERGRRQRRVLPHDFGPAALRALGDRALGELVARYVDAWERNDVAAFAELLVEDATFAMPPLSTWYGPRESVLAWARATSLSGAWRWKTVRTQANAQPALAFYAWDEAIRAFLPFALNVLTLRDGLVSDVTAFIVRSTGAAEAAAYLRFPEQPVDGDRAGTVFERFGLPDRLS